MVLLAFFYSIKLRMLLLCTLHRVLTINVPIMYYVVVYHVTILAIGHGL